MKKKFLFFILASAIAAFTGCTKDDDEPAPDNGGGNSNVVTLQNEISANTTWTKDKTYLLKGNVFVKSGVTLTINPGTIVKGDKETKGALVVNRGATINACGTATEPIIFTSNAPKGFRNRGDWGGIVILGYGASSNGPNATIEGISGDATSPNGKYGVGGVDPQDPNGGVDPTNGNTNTCLKYARIEYAGIALSTNNELNSLTMGGVGPNALIEYVLVSFAGDDAFEWFGGSNNHKYLIAYDTWDDDFDSDRGYSGKVQYGVIVRNPAIADFSGSRAFEASSNNSSTATPQSTCEFSNITVVGPRTYTSGTGTASSNLVNGSYRSAIDANSNTQIKIYNSIITGFREFGYNNGGANVISQYRGIRSFGNESGTLNGTAVDTADILALSDSVGYNNAFGISRGASNLTAGTLNFANPAPILRAGSAYATGAPARTGFEAAAFYGAFGTDGGNWNWTSKWVNFNPNAETY
jgi:hypothetical protein